MRVPAIASIKDAIETYYNNIELSTKDIAELFGCSRCKARELKEAAWNLQIIDEVPRWNESKCNTEVAYRAWGLDISNLETRLKKLNKLKEEGSN